MFSDKYTSYRESQGVSGNEVVRYGFDIVWRQPRSPLPYCVLLYNLIMRIFFVSQIEERPQVSDCPQSTVHCWYKNQLNYQQLIICSEVFARHCWNDHKRINTRPARTKKTSDLAVSGGEGSGWENLGCYAVAGLAGCWLGDGTPRKLSGLYNSTSTGDLPSLPPLSLPPSLPGQWVWE